MEERYLKLKKKQRRRLQKLAWKKARQSKAAPFEVVSSLLDALTVIRRTDRK